MSDPRAVILAAGRGTRLKAVTGDLPKPLLPLEGRPLVDHVIEQLRQAGFARFLLVVGYRHELFFEHFAADASVTCLIQETVNGTGSAARLAQSFTPDTPFLLIFGDILAAPADLAGLWKRLLDDPAATAVLGVMEVDDPWQGAAVYATDGVVTRIIEKPPQGTSTTRWNSAGIYAFRPAIFEALARLRPSSRGEYELTSAIVDLLETGERVLLHPLAGDWRDVGRPEDLDPATALLRATSMRPRIE
jgi:dTDP-glucose pyrophosphorylase